jgi:2',3'-cyclic-nucleotide 2'-phosphodiesterase
MKILFIGDVFGTLGKRVLAERLPSLLKEHSIDVCIANGENIAGGNGLTHNLISKLRKFGVNVITGGNHSFANADAFDDFANDPYVLRPQNFPPGNPGKGMAVYLLPDGRSLGILNLQGRVFFNESLDCPFRMGMAAIEELGRSAKAIIVDFHAEASSEKKAFAAYVDGKASAVIGTHTHVQTADEIVSAAGTAYITDAGMTGSEESIIGMKKENVLKKFLLQTAARFEPSESGPMLNGVVIDTDDGSGKATAISRIYERLRFSHEHDV